MLQVTVIFALAVLIGLDQLLKWLAVTHLKGELPFVLIDNVLEFRYSENPGAAFGILENHRWVFITITILAMIVFLALLLSGKLRHYRWAMVSGVLIVAGGLGNLIDRLFYGYVVDYIYVKLINFPIFNFADCCVVIGAIMLLVFFFFFYEDTPGEKWFHKKKTAEVAEAAPAEDATPAENVLPRQEDGITDGEEKLDRSDTSE